MNKASKTKTKTKRGGSMLAEYDFSQAVRGKYAKRIAEGSNVIVLSPDVAEFFRDSQSVNAVLRVLVDICARRHTRPRFDCFLVCSTHRRSIPHAKPRHSKGPNLAFEDLQTTPWGSDRLRCRVHRGWCQGSMNRSGCGMSPKIRPVGSQTPATARDEPLGLAGYS